MSERPRGTRAWAAASQLTATRDARDTLYLVLVCLGVSLPHLLHLPLWCSAAVGSLLAWRLWITAGGRRLPGRWLMVGLLMVAAAACWWPQKTLLGREPGVMLLVLLMALKTLELRARRDAIVVFFLGFFLVLAQFLESQSLLTALGMVASTWALLTLLVMAHLPAGRPPLWLAARVAARTVVLGSPVMLALFLLFPRIGPLWALPADATARTGLSDRMDLGQFASLVNDDSIALRVRFEGKPPPPQSLYFRGPVLGRFDGLRWSTMLDSALLGPAAPRTSGTAAIDPDRLTQALGLEVQASAQPYQMLLDATRLRQVPLLEGTVLRPKVQPADALPDLHLSAALNWEAPQALNQRVQLDAQVQTVDRWGWRMAPVPLRDLVDLPPGFNPRTLAWAAELRRQPEWAQADGLQLSRYLLAHLQRGDYRYTLSPGRDGVHTADALWFDRRTGFCEHFASAFVVMMRALDVPARIVTGYQGADAQAVDGWWAVRQRNAHAWAEIWVAERGWIRVDPTAAVSPQRIDIGETLTAPPGLVGQMLQRLDPGLWAPWQRWWERADQRWAQWVIAYGSTQQRDLLKDWGLEQPTEQLLSLALGLAAGLGAASLALAAWWNRPRRSPWQRVQQRVLADLRRQGLAADEHQGPRTWADGLMQALGAEQATPWAEQLLRLEQLRYAESTGPDGHVLNAWLRSWKRQWRQLDPQRQPPG